VDKPIDIILPTHNNLRRTTACIEELYANTEIPFNLLVIDDSDDVTPIWLEWFKKDHDNLTILRPQEKLTCGNQIINLGLENTTSELVVYIGNSIEVKPMWLTMALGLMEHSDDVGVVGFKLLKPEGVIEHAGIHFEKGMPHHMNYGVNKEPIELTCMQEMGELDSVGWALVLLRRLAIPVGGLEMDYYIGFRGYDDVDNCLQIKKNGWKVVYCGFGAATHYAGATRFTNTLENFKEHEENRKRFLKRWGGECESPLGELRQF